MTNLAGKPICLICASNITNDDKPGHGEALADNRPDFLATGQEWRTLPLWGIGLTKMIEPKSGFLHDGRARTLQEAILWHDGEGAASAKFFRRMTPDDRQLLIAYLESI